MDQGDPKVIITNATEPPPGIKNLRIREEWDHIALIYLNTRTGELGVAHQSAHFPSVLVAERIFRDALNLVITALFRTVASPNGEVKDVP